MMKSRILIVDDDQDILDLNNKILKQSSLKNEIEIAISQSISVAKKFIQREKFDLGLVDLNFNNDHLTGIDLIKYWRSQDPLIQILVVSSSKDHFDVQKSIRAGASDFLPKGFSPFEIEHRVRVALERRRAYNKELMAKIIINAELASKWKIIGKSEQMAELQAKIDKLAPKSVSVLIEGETGVGKELVARNLHYRGSRSSEPFIAVNCSAIPIQLAESILFGHEKGAFTSASERSYGLFEKANGGTLFLDEINSLSLELQAKLLRVVQEGIVHRLGSSKEIPIDVRLISASNEKLENSKKFRSDLFYRIAAVTLSVPPLKSRKEDIADLMDVFSRGRKFSKEVKTIFKHHTWPGNVRELKNVIDGMLALSDEQEVLHVTHLPNHLFYKKEESLEPKSRTELQLEAKKKEEEFFQRAYRLSNGNLSHLSRTLSMDRSYLHQKLVKMGIHRTR